MALGAKTFNFGKFLSFYSNNMEGNPNPTDVAHDWWTSMDNDEKHWYFYDNEQKYIDFIDSVMSISPILLLHLQRIMKMESCFGGNTHHRSFMYLTQVRILERSS